MSVRSILRDTAGWVGLVLCATTGCERDTSGLEPFPLSTDPVVFTDQLAEGVDFQAFMNSKYDAITVVTDEKYSGTASLKVVVPGPNDPTGWFAGGAFTSSDYRDLSGYNAVVFYARAAKNGVTLNVAGLGNDNTGTSKFEASSANLPLTTTWQRYVVPIPLPEKLSSERGLLYFAEGFENNEGYEFWLDEIAFTYLESITNPRPAIVTKTVGAFAGATVDPGQGSTTFSIGGTDQVVSHMPGYFSFFSSADSVVVVSDGVIRVVGEGEADVTARLGSVDATGTITVRGSAAPVTAAPRPTVPAANVISLFSNAYANVPVDTWWAEWSHNYSSFTDYKVAGDDVKAYTNLQYAGIEFASQTIDATSMTHFHVDVWVPAGTILFRVKLVDFGDDGTYQGAPDSERELTYSIYDPQPLLTGTWFGLEIPIENFMNGPNGLFQRAHLAQLIVSGTGNTAFIDNVYFHN